MNKTAAIIASCTTLEKQLDVKPTQLGEIMGLKCKVKAYKRYESELEDEISEAGLALYDYIQEVRARTEAFEGMLEATRAQREKVESLLAEKESSGQKERELPDTTRKSSLTVKDS
jgi:hypothetical protein